MDKIIYNGVEYTPGRYEIIASGASGAIVGVKTLTTVDDFRNAENQAWGVVNDSADLWDTHLIEFIPVV